ncbi:MAG: hypothetical protein HYX68_13925 [Planctomycetes bacterium]|nr:hypothetical protein [Planctomycetota bacterium]
MSQLPDGFWHDNGVAVYDYPPQHQPKYQLLGWMPVEEFRSLKLSIAISGKMLTPIVVDEDGEIIDGHHRDLAFVQLTNEGIKIERPVPHILKGLSEEEKRHFALRANMVRRQITRQKRREIIAEELRRSPDLANQWIAEISGCDGKTVAEVRKELESRSEIPTVATFRRRDGKTCPAKVIVPRTARQAEDVRKHLKVIGTDVSTCSPKMIKFLADEKARNEAAASLPPITLKDIDIRNCWFQDLDLAPESVHAIITDIPWEQDFTESGQLAELAAMADRVLVPGGFLVTYSGQLYLDVVMAEFCKKLKWGWQLCSSWEGEASIIHHRQVVNKHLPILVFSKGEWKKRRKWVDRLPPTTKDKSLYRDQRPLPEVDYLVEKFSDPGDLVCDPMLGSGSTAISCFRLNRRFVGSEMKDDIFKRAMARLHKEVRNDEPQSDHAQQKEI